MASSTQSHQRRPEDNARATRCACGVMLMPTIDRQPAPQSLCFTRCPSFTRCRPASTRYGPSSRGTPSPVAKGDLRLSGAVQTSTTSSASFGPCGEPRLVLKHRFLVFHCCHLLLCARAPNCRNDRAAPARSCRSSFLGSCSRVLSDYAMVAAPDLRDVPPLPLNIWPQVRRRGPVSMLVLLL